MESTKSKIAILLFFGLFTASLIAKADKIVRLERADYSAPKSILVLPPLNDSNDPEASYSILSTVTKPLANAGYYVYPVAVIDAFLKQNGLPTPYEMHATRLDKAREILGADAILYLHAEKYGQYYNIIDSKTQVKIKAKLVDTLTGELLWEGTAKENDHSSYSNDNVGAQLVGAIIGQVINSSYDSAHRLTYRVNKKLYSGYRFPKGPYYLERIKSEEK